LSRHGFPPGSLPSRAGVLNRPPPRVTPVIVTRGGRVVVSKIAKNIGEAFGKHGPPDGFFLVSSCRVRSGSGVEESRLEERTRRRNHLQPGSAEESSSAGRIEVSFPGEESRRGRGRPLAGGPARYGKEAPWWNLRSQWWNNNAVGNRAAER